MDLLKTNFLLIAATLALSGCASGPWGSQAGAGGAVYSYTHQKGDEVCMVQITSAREVIGGDIKVGPDCGIESSADTADGAGDAIKVIGAIVNKLPGAPSE